ncbi:MAG TPA: GNAT family N-acetyltransferase [Gemmatimonadaceae bacterium]|nr:GNAT family N-acetyltransferase [Gemmatimonadaceae bacterium]
MPHLIREARPDEIEQLIPLLLLAEPSESALRWGLRNLSDTVYRMDDAATGELVGAASVRWNDEPCELEELAVAAARQGRGLGKELVAWLLAEGRRRGKRAMVVGTRNASIGNIAFYQKCGFRMDHVRADYFWYYREPVYEHGIRVRDLLVFRCDLAEDGDASSSRRRRRRR